MQEGSPRVFTRLKGRFKAWLRRRALELLELDDLENRLDRIESDVNDCAADSDINDLQSSVDSLETDLEEVKNQLDSATSDISDLESSVNDVQTDMDNMSNEIDALA
jgi:chromosome segregation ATPase